MTAIPHAAKALTSAFDRLEHASGRLLGAVNGASGADPAVALADMIQAKHQVKASVAVVRLADAMWRDLLELSVRR